MEVTALAVETARQLNTPPYSRNTVVNLLGQALRDHAFVLGFMGRITQALTVADEAERMFGRVAMTYAAEPDVLVKELAGDTAIQAADTLLLTVPNQLGVEYNAHAVESILRYVAPELGWR